jgi:putative ABC transport system permease protein
VVGVMPEGFRFPINHGFWTALPTGPSLYGPGEGPKIFVLGRLSPGLSQAAAQAELAALGERTAAELPAVYEHLRPTILRYVHSLLDVQQYPGWFVWAMQLFGILILTVVAVNVAVLVYARTASRWGEIAVRTALGAGRRRIVIQLFVEALALSLLAAALGLLIAQFGYRQIFAMSDTRFLPYWIGDRGLSAAAIPYAVGLAVLAALLVGVMPALRATGSQLQSTLRQLGGGTEMRMGSTWTVLIVAQVAIAVAVLPVVLGLAVETIWKPRPAPTFPAEEILTFRLDRGQDEFSPLRPELDAYFANQQAELMRRVEAEPGVAGVTYALNLPLSGEPVRVESDQEVATSDPTPVLVTSVDLEYFDVLGVPLLAGRRFEPGDLTDGAAAVLVNRTFVQRFLAGGDALGRRVRKMPGIGRDVGENGPGYEIVGVVGDLYEYKGRPELRQPAMYQPIAPGPEPLSIAVRTRGTTPADLAPRVREIAQEVAPDWQLSASPMDALYSGPDQDARRFLALVVGLMTLSVLLLSAAGISALMSFAVTRRRREIGIRAALGAPHGRILTSIFSRSLRQLAHGLVLGVAAAGVLDRLTGGALLGGRAAILLPLVAAMMVLAGLLATMGPARRTLRIHPIEAFKAE